MDHLLKKQLALLQRKEAHLLEKRTRPVPEKNSRLSDKVERHIPARLKDTLEAAFYKGFQLVFEKGVHIIEKTYDKDQLLLDHELFELGYTKRPNKKNWRRVNRQAARSTNLNVMSTVAEGTVLGLLGIGLPDIPLFIGMLLKNIYEVSLSYGFDYDNPKERLYILKLIEGALSVREDFTRLNQEIDEATDCLDSQKPLSYPLDEQTRATARALSTEMIVMKFIQGLPVVGMVGGITNFACYKKIMDYARLKYQKRYLLGRIRR